MCTSYYTGGASGWGTMIIENEDLDDNFAIVRVVEEYEVDEFGVPTKLIRRETQA